MKRLLTLLLVPSLAFAQPEIDPSPEIDPPPSLPGESEPGYEPGEDGTRIEGDLNTSNSNNGNVSKTYNGAGSGRQMPASTAVSPSLMSNGQQSCLKSISGGLQLVSVGISSGKYIQDPECNRRLNAITLSNMGMKVASVSLMCQNAQVWRAMFMSATPCPIIRGGRLLVGKTALLEVKSNPAMWIPDYHDDKEFYDALLVGGRSNDGESSDERSISDRFRSTLRDGDR